MLKSMTGYGLASKDINGIKITVEIRSLNSKFLELNLKLPKAFNDKEILLRNICSKEIERGKVNLVITIDKNLSEIKGATINTQLLKSYYQQLKLVDVDLAAESSNLLKAALTLPEVIVYEEDVAGEEEWGRVEVIFQQALKEFNIFRSSEGSNLDDELKLRLQNIQHYFDEVIAIAPKRVPQIRERLSQFLNEYASQVKIDQNRFEQELIYYIDKLDITEEQIRLKSHLDYFLKALKDHDANGKKLGFITQEIGREINTMGAKANDAQMQQMVVGMKEELEKIKEQLLNVL